MNRTQLYSIATGGLVLDVALTREQWTRFAWWCAVHDGALRKGRRR